MNKKLIYILTVSLLSVIAFLLMYFVINWKLQKALFCSFGAALAMLIADATVFYIKRKNKNTYNSGDTDLDNSKAL